MMSLFCCGLLRDKVNGTFSSGRSETQRGTKALCEMIFGLRE